VSASPDTASSLAACVQAMPAGHVRALAAALAPFPEPSDAARTRVLAALANPSYRQHAEHLLDLWRRLPGCSGAALALALETALAVRERERDAEVVEVVATGPSTPHVSLRQTRAVLLELVARARRELIIVSYAAYRVPEIVEALVAACGRGVIVRLVLETTADSAGTLTLDASAAFESLRDRVEVYVWPLELRTGGSRLHAKTVVADADLAFVTSANLTGHALDQNLEVGVLVSGGNVPRRLADHVRALIGKGILRRIP
jgi:cardiolipin synthase A/B